MHFVITTNDDLTIKVTSIEAKNGDVFFSGPNEALGVINPGYIKSITIEYE